MRLTVMLLILIVLLLTATVVYVTIPPRPADLPPTTPVEGAGDPVPTPAADTDPAPPHAGNEPAPDGGESGSGSGSPEEEQSGSRAEEKVARTSVEDALEKTIVDVNYEDESLLHVLIEMAAEAGVGIVIPEDLQQELEEGEENKVTMRADGVSVANVFQLIFLTKGGRHDWHAKDGQVHIRRAR